MIPELANRRSSKQISFKVNDSTSFGLIKGGNTVPLVSELLSVIDRNK